MLLKCGVGEEPWRVPWTARRSDQSILKEINPEYSLEGLMLKLKFQYFDHLCKVLTHLKRAWCWGRLKAGGEGDNRGWEDWMASPTQRTWVWATSGSWWWTGKPKNRHKVHGVAKSQTWLSHWTELIVTVWIFCIYWPLGDWFQSFNWQIVLCSFVRVLS